MTKPIIKNSDYKVILRHSKGWQNFKAARLQISVLPNPDYDPRFRAILEWTSRNFDIVTLCLHDSIQRYNHQAIITNDEKSYAKSIHDGDQWLKKNIFPTDVFIDKILRWDDLIAHKDFPTAHAKIISLHEKNKEFCDAIEHDINTYKQRCESRGECFNSSRLSLSLNFMLEEISAYIPLFQNSSAADIHPGMRLKALALLQNGLGDFNFMPNLLISAKTFDISPLATKISEAA